MRRTVRWTTTALAAAALAWSASSIHEVRRAIDELSAAAPDVPATLAELSGSALLRQVTAAGPYLGFDTSIYPGDDAMRAWRDEAHYHWVGYYLPAPCHKDASWSGKRETLETMGWGLAVVYVGQQTWGRTPNPRARVPNGAVCATNLVSDARGLADGDDAVAKAAAEGFPAGTVIFLDIEYMASVPGAMRDYYVAWTERVLADGRYRAGYYAHTRNAALIYADVKGVFESHGLRAEPPFWIAGGSNFGRDRAPQDVGHAFAAVWQGVLDTWEERNSVKLPIDVNVASLPSPSSHAFAAEVVAAD